MKKKDRLKMRSIFNCKLEEIINLMFIYPNLSRCGYEAIKSKVDLSEIETLKELDLLELMTSANSSTAINLYFHDLISIDNYRIADKVSDVLNILIGGRRAELKLGL